jgi:hypothetical protein
VRRAADRNESILQIVTRKLRTGASPARYAHSNESLAGDGLGSKEIFMKLRNLFLGVVALIVLAGSVVPANAAAYRHHHRHHHRR